MNPPCWSEKVVPLVAMYITICSLLYMTGMIDIRHGPGVNLLIINLFIMTLFTIYVMMNPSKIFIGGCEKY
jgi:antibiotic biosynthesis monooxygenase (ABM) superfamily enzyme